MAPWEEAAQPLACAGMHDSPYSSPHLLHRLSIKMLDASPDMLPPDALARLQQWLQVASAEAVQGCLRPGERWQATAFGSSSSLPVPPATHH